MIRVMIREGIKIRGLVGRSPIRPATSGAPRCRRSPEIAAAQDCRKEIRADRRRTSGANFAGPLNSAYQFPANGVLTGQYGAEASFSTRGSRLKPEAQ